MMKKRYVSLTALEYSKIQRKDWVSYTEMQIARIIGAKKEINNY